MVMSKIHNVFIKQPSVDAGAIIGDCYGTSVDACAIMVFMGKIRNFLLHSTSVDACAIYGGWHPCHPLRR